MHGIGDEMRFKQYLTENRSKTLKEDDAYKMIKKHCKKAYNAFLQDHVIYRGLSNSNNNLYVDPSKSTRKSRNTDNYYTLLIDNNPQWKGYPKRSKSIICTNSQRKTLSFGDGKTYQVFPYDNSKIGISPEHDFWFSFHKTLGEHNSLSYFNFKLKQLATNFDVDIDKYLTNWNTFKKGIDLIDQNMQDEGIDDKRNIPPFNTTSDNLLDNIFNLLSPQSNGFKSTTNVMDVPINNGGLGQEVWTDGKSILIDIYSIVYLKEFMGDK